MNKLIVIVASLIVGVAAAGALMWQSTYGRSEKIQLLNFSVTAGQDSPILSLTFSEKIDSHMVVRVLNSSYRIVGVWTPENGLSGATITITKIYPPNLIGTYYVLVERDGNMELNKSIVFRNPVLKVIKCSVQEYVKGEQAYVEYVNVTLSEDGDSPYYYNRLRWSMDDTPSNEKIPQSNFAPSSQKTVTINIAKYMSRGEHTLVIHFDYFDFTTLTIRANVNV